MFDDVDFAGDAAATGAPQLFRTASQAGRRASPSSSITEGAASRHALAIGCRSFDLGAMAKPPNQQGQVQPGSRPSAP